MSSKLRNFISRIRKNGWRSNFNYYVERIRTPLIESRLGVNTRTVRSRDELGFQNQGYGHYVPVSYKCLSKVLSRIQMDIKKAGFLDYGSGMGRVIVTAATRPFCRVLGIELNADLARLAEQNLTAAREKLVCRNIEIVVANAIEFAVPQDIHVAFFFNPFTEDILIHVLARIRESLAAMPRPFTLIYINCNAGTTQLLKDIMWLNVMEEYDDWCMPGTLRKIMILQNAAIGDASQVQR